MSNAGGAWDNSKKYIENEKVYGGKKSETHKACVVGDTVGDPFKDTSGPALNILIKLMSVISLVIAPSLKAWQIDDNDTADPSDDHIIEWEPKSVGVGAGILIVLLVVLYFIQKQIDYGYGVKRKEVEASIAEQEAKAKNAAEAAVAANPAAYGALKQLNDSEKEGAIDMAAAEKLLAALRNPVPAKMPVTPMQIEVQSSS